MKIVCPTCGETREVGYQAVWSIRRGLNSGDCNGCAATKRKQPLLTRLRTRISAPDENGYWPWTGERDRQGYGRLTVGSSRPAHRLVYQELVGEIPDGLELDHLCRNPGCVNPEHLEAVTHAENLRRAADAVRPDRCPAGHLFDLENTYISPAGYRKCRACRRDKNRAAYHAQTCT